METKDLDYKEDATNLAESEVLQKEYRPKYKTRLKLLYLLFLLLIIPAVVLPIALSQGVEPVIDVSVGGLKEVYLLNEIAGDISAEITVNGTKVSDPVVDVSRVDTSGVGKKSVRVLYSEKEYNFDYTVVGLADYKKTVAALSCDMGSLRFYQNKVAGVPAGAKMSVKFMDSSSTDIVVTDDIVTVPINTTNAGKFELRLEYGGVGLGIAYDIIAVAIAEINLTEDESGSYPQRIYAEGDQFNRSRGALEVLYNNGDRELVPLSDPRVVITDGFSTSVLSDELSCIISFGECQTELYYKVSELEIMEVTIDTAFKKEYFVGEALDLTGGKLKVRYRDAENNIIYKTIAIESYMVSGFDSTEAGERQLVVSFGNSFGSVETHAGYSVVLP